MKPMILTGMMQPLLFSGISKQDLPSFEKNWWQSTGIEFDEKSTIKYKVYKPKIVTQDISKAMKIQKN